MKEILNPSCSTIVWRLNLPKGDIREQILDKFDGKSEEETSETQTDSYPNGCLNEMIILLEEAEIDKSKIDNAELEILENVGGGGNGYYVEECLKIAKKYIKGEISRGEAEKMEEERW